MSTFGKWSIRFYQPNTALPCEVTLSHLWMSWLANAGPLLVMLFAVDWYFKRCDDPADILKNRSRQGVPSAIVPVAVHGDPGVH